MDLKLKRSSFEIDGVFGQMTSLDGSFIAVPATLEHAFIYGDGIKAAIPPGTYTCKRRMSPRFKMEVFEVMDVPGHDYIELHPGNKNEDTEGCVLTGKKRVGPCVLQSREAFQDLMKLQAGLDTFQLVVE